MGAFCECGCGSYTMTSDEYAKLLKLVNEAECQYMRLMRDNNDLRVWVKDLECRYNDLKDEYDRLMGIGGRRED